MCVQTLQVGSPWWAQTQEPNRGGGRLGAPPPPPGSCNGSGAQSFVFLRQTESRPLPFLYVHQQPPTPSRRAHHGRLPRCSLSVAQTRPSPQDAKKFIYIAGWSVWTDLYMIREPVKCPSLGDLLKQKAAQGVCVRVLLWNDATSVDNSVVNALLSKTKSGLMGTHHIETAQFFHKSGVICELVKCHSQVRRQWPGGL